MRRIVFVFALSLGLAGLPAKAAEPVNLELVLLADASRSIDDGEIRLQREGYAAAITYPDVLAAMGGGYLRRIALTYVKWGDESSQEVVVPWQMIEGPGNTTGLSRTLFWHRSKQFRQQSVKPLIIGCVVRISG